MELVPLADVELAYVDIERIDYQVGGQFYGTLRGTLEGDRLSGSIQLTNLATARPDGVNTPTMRGVLTTPGGGQVWVVLDGIATLRQHDLARVFLTSAQLRTSEPQYDWVNTVFGVLEGVLDTDTLKAHARLFECRATLE